MTGRRQRIWLPIVGALGCWACNSTSSESNISSCEGTTRAGIATFYDADGTGACSFPRVDAPILVAALGNDDYNNASACGTCIQVTGARGSTTVRVVDRCPECSAGHIDLSEAAFEAIDDRTKGRVPITWAFTECPTDGPVDFHFKEGSSEFWTAVQVRNHRQPIASFAYLDQAGRFVDLQRKTYNFFVAENGMGKGPFTFRIESPQGQVLQEAGIVLGDDETRSGSEQFPSCR